MGELQTDVSILLFPAFVHGLACYKQQIVDRPFRAWWHLGGAGCML